MIDWSIAPKTGPRVLPVSGLEYSGQEQTGVREGEGYTLSGTWRASAIGNYTATATLDKNHIWSNDSTEPKSIQWSISAYGVTPGLQIGERFFLGHYEQDNDESNGKEAIEWRVLTTKDGRALAVSKYGLDTHVFNESSDDGNEWETSELKDWLDNTFTPAVFNSADRAVINSLPTLLESYEAREFFTDADDRMCIPTPYAVAQGVYAASPTNSCYWWLRTKGRRNYVTCVGTGGYVEGEGISVWNRGMAVRPIIWVNLS